MKIILLLLMCGGIVFLFKIYKTFKSLNKKSKDTVKDEIEGNIIDILGD